MIDYATRIKLHVGTTVKKALPDGGEIFLKVIDIALIVDNSMPFVHITFSRWTTWNPGETDTVTAVFGEVVQWLTSQTGWQIA